MMRHRRFHVVRLHTEILVPKGAKGAPILLTRTPYSARVRSTYAASAHLAPTLGGNGESADIAVEAGYIRVFQDVRGKYGSEGDYVMNRPLQGPLNPTNVDHATRPIRDNQVLQFLVVQSSLRDAPPAAGIPDRRR